MSDPTPYELYRVITDYEALQDGFLDRIEDLNAPMDQIDAAAGFTRGNTQKLLQKANKRWARTFAGESLGKMLKGTGLVLALVVDDERFASLRLELTPRKRIIKPAIARIAQPAWLFKRKTAIEMGKKRWLGVSDSKRTRLAKRAAKARWRKAKINGALLAQVRQPSSANETVASTRECQMVQR